LALDYLDAVEPELLPGDELVIVDAGSEPALDFATIRVGDVGFSGGCNAGLRHASAEMICFLNNDIQVIRRGWLAEIRQALEPGYLVGPLRNGPHTQVDGVSYPYLDGWCLSGYREDLLALGGWDTEYQEPSYFGDNDLCLRARARGMSLREVRPGLRHLENTTAGPASDPRVREASAVNRARYIARARELLVAA
jgi:GT2 family glycosyltransferase